MEKMSRLPLAKLTGTKLYESVIKGSKTLQEIAENYDCTYEQFIEACRRELGKDGWKRLVRADERNTERKNNKHHKEGNEMKKNNTQPQQRKELSREELTTNIRITERQLENASATLSGCQVILTQSKQKEKEAEMAYKEAQRKTSAAQSEKDRAMSQVNALVTKLNGFKAQLEELNRKVINLMAPGYRGDIPEGQLVSTIPLEGILNLRVEKGTVLMKEPSIMEVIEAGFSDLKEVALALEFAKLVIKYQTEEQSEEVKLLVDDERICAILRQQGVEI